jgi:hypothetical protein
MRCFVTSCQARVQNGSERNTSVGWSFQQTYATYIWHSVPFTPPKGPYVNE